MLFAALLLRCFAALVVCWYLFSAATFLYWRYVQRKKFSKFPGKVYSFFNILAFLSEYSLSTLNTFTVRQYMLDFYNRLARENPEEDFAVQWNIAMPNVLVISPEALKIVLNSPKTIEKPWFYRSIFGIAFGTCGLVTSEAKLWKPHRKLLNPCFRLPVLLDNNLEEMDNIAQDMARSIKKNCTTGFIELENVIPLTVMKINCETVLGLDTSTRLPEIKKIIHDTERGNEIITSRVLSVWKWLDFFFYMSKEGKELVALHSKMRDFINEAINNYNRESKESKQTCMDVLMQKYLAEEMTRDEVISHSLTFLLAGFETVSVSITWTLYLIGLHQDVQEKIQEELYYVLGHDVDRPIAKKDVEKMKYLECVLKESKRLYPPVPFAARFCTEDLDINGKTVPANTTLLISMLAQNRNEKFFPEAEKFDPDRFLPTSSKARPQYSFMPFLMGPRDCIGKTQAALIEKVVISTILRHFSLESLDARDSFRLAFGISLSCDRNHRIKIKDRN